MVSELFFYQLALIALVWLCCMLHWVWPSDRPTVPSPLPQPTPPRRTGRVPVACGEFHRLKTDGLRYRVVF